MSAASPKSVKMDKYFCIAISFSFAVAINGQLLTGSGVYCNTKCANANEICFGTGVNRCYCPAGFKGDNCNEVNTNYIDATCFVPRPLLDSCDEAIDQCQGNCPSNTECCSDGCTLSCRSLPPPTCTSTVECTENKICYQSLPPMSSCSCPLGFTGDDCTDRLTFGYDNRCPLPTDPVNLCAVSEFVYECVVNDPSRMCPDGEICCVGSNGCSYECFPTGCKNAVDLKTCTDQGKLCIDDDSNESFTCQCPYGYSGDMCATPFAGFDAMCPFPEVSGNTCDEFETPVCTESGDCQEGDVCCSTGCGTTCVNFSDGACRPGEFMIHNCPDVCQFSSCVKYPSAICRVRPCSGCWARWYIQQGDITAYCG
ncbi:uncharacterized protein LOC120329923 [Styela clava]